MADRDMLMWARGDQATKFFDKQLPNLIKALNQNTIALNERRKDTKSEVSKPEPKPEPKQEIKKEDN